MNAAPVTPAEAKNIIISPTATFCQAFIKLFLQLPQYFYKVVNFLWRADGTIANDFLRQIFNPGDLKFSASALSQTSDWLLCDGSAVVRADYPDLYDAIGTSFGAGNGTTTFNLPDFRGRFPIGSGTTTGLLDRDGAAVAGSAYALGGKGGEEKVKLIESELPAHEHQMFIDDTKGAPKVAPTDELHVTVSGHFDTERSYDMTAKAEDDETAPTVGPTEEVGSDTPHNNIPPYTCVHVYIKT